MKIGLGKRFLMFLYWLFSFVICAVFAVYLFRPEIISMVADRIADVNPAIITAALIAVAVLYVILFIVQGSIIFHRNKKRIDRGFITVDSSDNSNVRISIAAIEQMVRQSVYNIEGITDMKIAIENVDDAISINIVAAILNGCHVPTITMNMQRAIRKFVELNCGVAVRNVAVSINSVTAPGDVSKKKKRGAKYEAAPAINSNAVDFSSAAEPAAVQDPVHERPEQVSAAIEEEAAVTCDETLVSEAPEAIIAEEICGEISVEETAAEAEKKV